MFIRFLSCALLGCMLSLCAHAETIYKRIVSLAPSLSQNLYYLGKQESLVGCTSYCDASKLDGKPAVASAVKPNLEKIIALRPDLVITSRFTSVKDVEILRKMGIRVEIFPTAHSFDEICDHFMTLARLTGAVDEATRLLDEVKQKVNQLYVANKNRGIHPRIFIQIGASPLYAVIPNTFQDDFIRFSGGVNIAAQLKKAIVGREFVLAQKPDYIFIVTMGIVGEEEEKEWRRFTHIPAARDANVFIIDSKKACYPTPVTFLETLEIITNHIYKK